MNLLDTPGILWPKFEDQEVGQKLALTGAIKDAMLNLEDVALFGINFLEEKYPARLKEWLKIEGELPQDIVENLISLGRKRVSLWGIAKLIMIK